MVSSRAEAKGIIKIWRRHFNEEPPRSSLGYLTRTSSWLKMQDQRPVRQQVGTLRVLGASAPRPVAEPSREGTDAASEGCRNRGPKNRAGVTCFLHL
jgi:hypothetical protein